MCTTAAPAAAASSAEAAIWSGVTGTLSLIPVESPEPVIAQVMKARDETGSMGSPSGYGSFA
jgi:hypothetical protein